MKEKKAKEKRVDTLRRRRESKNEKQKYGTRGDDEVLEQHVRLAFYLFKVNVDEGERIDDR